MNARGLGLKKLFEDLQPDAVVTWGPSGWTGHPDHRIVSAVVTEVFQSKRWEQPSQLYYTAVPTRKVPAPNPIPLAWIRDSWRSEFPSPSKTDKAKDAWHCDQSQYTPEQIEQLHQSLVSAQEGAAHFQPLIPTTAKSGSLLL